MARPQKNNCDYFSHDNNMRNHIKVKAIRQKFPNGYAIWSMFLEYLTGADGNVFEYSELNFELLSGDFGFTSEEIRSVIDYAVKLEMLNIDSETCESTFINSPSLDERLAYVYEKRGQAKERSEKQKRILGKFAAETTDETAVTVTETPITVTETPQSKGNKTKGNKSKGNDFNAKSFLLELFIEEQIVIDFLKNRKTKRLSNTKTAFEKIAKEIQLTCEAYNTNANEVLKVAVEKGWGGFEKNFIDNIKKNKNGAYQQSTSKNQGATLAEIAAIAEKELGHLPDR